MGEYAAPHVTAAQLAAIDANDEPDGQRYVVTDDGYSEWEAVGADGARVWIRIGRPGIPTGGVSPQVLTKKTATDYDVEWAEVSVSTYRQQVGPWTVDNLGGP